MPLTKEYLASLPKEKRLAIILQEKIKCKSDAYYTITSYFDLTDPATMKTTLFDMYPYQERAVIDFEENDYCITMKTRQTGLTTIAEAYTAWFLITKKRMVVNALAQDKKRSKKFLKGVRMFLDDARKKAPWLVPAYAKNNNGKEEFALTNDSLISAEANKPDACRGEVINLLIIDEVAAITWMDDIWASAGLTLTRSRGKCIAISCVTKDTYVFTDQGIQQIEDFIPAGIDHSKKETYIVDQYNIQGKDKKRLGNSFFINGYGKTRKIITPYASVESSLKHRSWAYKNGEYNWVEAEKLNIGDWVNIQYGMNCWGNNDDVSDFIYYKGITNNRKEINIPQKLTPDWCYLLGLYIAEGNISKNINSIFISCGDGITSIFDSLGLKYYLDPLKKVRHELCSAILVDFFEYLGFDPKHKAHKKEIPKRLMSISKENMKALLQGIFDGDGYSTIKNNRVGINLKSEKLIEQIRIILGNFGILSTYGLQTKEKLNSYYNKKGIIHRYDSHCLEINSHFATVFHKEIGFRINRKLQTFKENKNHIFSIPNGDEIARKLCKIGNTSIDTIRTKHKIWVHYNSNPGQENLNKICDHVIKQNPELINNEELIKIKDQILIDNSIWVQITDIEEKENYTYDFDLPENKDDFWFKSVVYNLVNQEDTPKGMQGWYFDQYTNAEVNGWKVIDAHWSEHPIYKQGMYQWIKDLNHPDGGYVKTFIEEWPDMNHKQNVKKYGQKENYKHVLDGKMRSPWYDYESRKLGKNKTKCELDCTFAGSGGEVLEPEIIRGIMLKAQEYKIINPSLRGIWASYKEYIPYNPLHQFLLSADAMTGDGSDYSAFVVIDLNTLEVCATFKDQLEPKAYAKVINDVGLRYGKAMVIVENQQGVTVLFELKDKHKYPRLYYTTLKAKQADRRERKRKMGFWQSPVTKSLGGDKLEEMLISGELKIPCMTIVNELHTWVWNKRGIRDHATGKHDDMCVKKGTFIHTKEGIKKVEEIKKGDEVLTHLGRYRKVSNIFKRKVTELVEIKSKGKLPLYITPNHPLYVHTLNKKKPNHGSKYLKFEYISPTWKSLEDMEYNIVNKSVCNVIDKTIDNIEHIDLLKYCPETYREIEGKLTGYTYNGTRRNNKSNVIDRYLKITPELCWIVGYYLAEGSCGPNNVSWASHNKESGFRNKVASYFEKLNLKTYESKCKAQCTTVSIANKVLRNLFHTIGKGNSKKLPVEFLFLNPALQREIICGYFAGDGSFGKMGISSFSISPNIALNIHQFLLRNNVISRLKEDLTNFKKGNKKGIRLSINNEESKKVLNWIINDLTLYKQKKFNDLNEIKQGKISQIKFDNTGDYVCSLIRTITKYDCDEYVYNFEVEEDNSYVANGIVVHNCMALTMAMFYIHYVLNRRASLNKITREQFEVRREMTIVKNSMGLEDIFNDLLEGDKKNEDRLSIKQNYDKNRRRDFAVFSS